MLSPIPIGGGDILATAFFYLAAGLSVIPVRTDGSKAPRFSNWRQYSERPPTLAELRNWFSLGSAGIGILGGPASGNLAVFDFETLKAFKGWTRKLSRDDRALLARCPVIKTPSGGAHVYCRLSESVRGHKYAKDATGKCLIETRGHGHYVLAPGSPGACHKTGRPYRLLHPGWLSGVAAEPIPVSAFHNLTIYAAALNEYSRPLLSDVVGERWPGGGGRGNRPGDDFNRRVGWGQILGSCGWTVYRCTSSATYWCRPDKDPPGISASIGYCKDSNGNDLLYVFSTSAAPFEAERCYSKFAAYALLKHDGDFAETARALAHAGYGTPLPSKKEVR